MRRKKNFGWTAGLLIRAWRGHLHQLTEALMDRYWSTLDKAILNSMI